MKLKYTYELLRLFLQDNNFKYDTYTIKDQCVGIKVGTLIYSSDTCKINIEPSLATWYRDENEAIFGIVTNNLIIFKECTYFYSISDSNALRVELHKVSECTEEEIKKLKDTHNYFDYNEYESAEDIAKQFAKHIENNRYNLLATFNPIPTIKKRLK